MKLSIIPPCFVQADKRCMAIVSTRKVIKHLSEVVESLGLHVWKQCPDKISQ